MLRTAAPTTNHASAYGALPTLPFLRFDKLEGYSQRRLNIVWIENTLDCRTWTYYCDLKDTMARIHRLCVPRHSITCVEGRVPRGFKADAIVVGPRYMANVAHTDETLGFSREQYAHLPLAVVQNKMYAATAREIVGDSVAKLRWTHDVGAVVGFTWLNLASNFTAASSVPHYRLPFGVDISLYGRHADNLARMDTQPIDIGFTGASNHKYPLRESILKLIRSMNVSSYLGTWQQTSLRVGTNQSWKALDRLGYVAQIARTKMWVSTTGPSDIVGTRYFEVLASGTTLLLCNRKDGAYENLLEDGVHAVLFDDMEDLRMKITYYLNNELARRRVVRAAFDLARRVHSWDARARFISHALEAHVRERQRHNQTAAFFVSNRSRSSDVHAEQFVGCIDARTFAENFEEYAARRPLRRFTVAACALACRSRQALHFAMQCGGFCSGNGHRLGRCFCASSAKPIKSDIRFRPRTDCATTCSLQDARPCGGFDSMALFSINSSNVLSAHKSRQIDSAKSKISQQNRQAAAVLRDARANVGHNVGHRHVNGGRFLLRRSSRAVDARNSD